MFQHPSGFYKSLTAIGIQGFKYLLHGNIFMGICGFSWAVSGDLMVTGDWDSVNWWWAFTLALGIVGVYNGARVYLLKKAAPIPTELTENQAWSLAHYRPLSGIAAIALLGGGILLTGLPWEYWMLTGMAGILVAGYYLSALVPGQKGLRHFGWLKNLVIGLVWAGLTVLPPLILYGYEDMGVWLFVERTFFIYLLMIPFDIKDIDADQKTGVKTIPAQLGIPKSKGLIIALMVLLAVLYGRHYQGMLLIAHLLPLAYLAVLLPLLHPGRSSLHFLVFWDGAIFLEGILVMGWS